MNVTLFPIDYTIIAIVFSFTMLLGLVVSRSSGKSSDSFFLGGRGMPWWLLGMSMVATTFSSDTPNLVTDFVRTHGVYANWSWWCFIPTGMLTVFVYAKLWRRLGVVTDIEFYEIRYSGRTAMFLRGFRAIYLGGFLNVMIIASVTLAAIKIGGAMLNLTPMQSVFWAMLATMVFSAMGGFKGVLYTDFFLFFVAMAGSIAAAVCAVRSPEIGSLPALFTKLASSPATAGKVAVMPLGSSDDLICFFIVPFAITWWSVWYSGSEPGGGGYIAQRMFAAKDERHAMWATLFFNVMHYAVRPWPWIIVALASLVIYPNLDSLRAAVGPAIPGHQIGNDLAYSLMMTRLPAGITGLVVAGLLAAYMSTLSTLLNWGASCLVNDCYQRFARKDATPKELVWAGRAATVLLMVFGALVSFQLSDALSVFKLLLSIGAGTGLLFLIRWFWWRINASCELAAMIGSFAWAAVFALWKNCPLNNWQQMAVQVALTTATWLPFAWLGPKTDMAVLVKFVRKINPGGFWGPVYRAMGEFKEGAATRGNLTAQLLASLVACFMIAFAIFGVGMFIYGRPVAGTAYCIACVICAFVIWKILRRESDVADN
ncbi:MAG: Na+:solute symporter [Victivallaceae bacterium]|nr:Na+:solute symporter [Victivallaceae bacterium]